MDDARAALARVAADMGAGQVKIVAQELGKQSARIDSRRHLFTIDRHRDARHGHSSDCSTGRISTL